jgi:hypothetical protein
MKTFGQAEAIAPIASMTNSGALIQVTTSVAHGLSTGHKVFISGVLGTTEANGYWTVTVTSTTVFTLNSSTFANTHEAGTGVVYRGVRLRVAYTSPTTHLVLTTCFYRVSANGAAILVANTPAKVTGTSTILLVAQPENAFILDNISIFNPSNQTQNLFLEAELSDNTTVTLKRITGVLQNEEAVWSRGGANIIDPTGSGRVIMPPLP